MTQWIVLRRSGPVSTALRAYQYNGRGERVTKTTAIAGSAATVR